MYVCYRSWLSSVWNSLFGDDDDLAVPFKAPPDPAKLKSSLVEIDKNLRNLFGVC